MNTVIYLMPHKFFTRCKLCVSLGHCVLCHRNWFIFTSRWVCCYICIIR